MASDRTYDSFGHRHFLSVEGVSVVGTQAADASLAATRLRLPFAAKCVGASLVQTTGGTGAQVLKIRKSLAGTGAFAAFGTYTLGTNADGSSGDFSVTETDFAAGDHIDIAIAEGTAARTDAVNFTMNFEELYA